MKRHTIEVQIQAVRICQRRRSTDRVSNELGIKDYYVMEWVGQYRLYGTEVLWKQPSQELGLVNSNSPLRRGNNSKG